MSTKINNFYLQTGLTVAHTPKVLLALGALAALAGGAIIGGHMFHYGHLQLVSFDMAASMAAAGILTLIISRLAKERRAIHVATIAAFLVGGLAAAGWYFDYGISKELAFDIMVGGGAFTLTSALMWSNTTRLTKKQMMENMLHEVNIEMTEGFNELKQWLHEETEKVKNKSDQDEDKKNWQAFLQAMNGKQVTNAGAIRALDTTFLLCDLGKEQMMQTLNGNINLEKPEDFGRLHQLLHDETEKFMFEPADVATRQQWVQDKGQWTAFLTGLKMKEVTCNGVKQKLNTFLLLKRMENPTEKISFKLKEWKDSQVRKAVDDSAPKKEHARERTPEKNREFAAIARAYSETYGISLEKAAEAVESLLEKDDLTLVTANKSIVGGAFHNERGVHTPFKRQMLVTVDMSKKVAKHIKRVEKRDANNMLNESGQRPSEAVKTGLADLEQLDLSAPTKKDDEPGPMPVPAQAKVKRTRKPKNETPTVGAGFGALS